MPVIVSERDEVVILALNVIQFGEDKHPKAEAEAVSQSTSLSVLVNPSPKVKTLSLPLNVVQSAASSNPLLAAEAEGRLNVHVFVEEEILKSVPVVELARGIDDCFAFHVAALAMR